MASVTEKAEARIREMIHFGEVSNSASIELRKVVEITGKDPDTVLDERGLRQLGVTPLKVYREAIERVAARETPTIGLVLKELKGKGNPVIVGELLNRKPTT
jgi:Asp-tRNA(Asn)/Glu-tRNA(Gln) amidotransferase B subunit